MRWGLFPGLLLLGWHDFLPFYLIDNSESQIVAWDFVFVGGLPLQVVFCLQTGNCHSKIGNFMPICHYHPIAVQVYKKLEQIH
jgi:hypothetical protein